MIDKGVSEVQGQVHCKVECRSTVADTGKIVCSRYLIGARYMKCTCPGLTR